MPAVVYVEQLCHQKRSEFFMAGLLCVFSKRDCGVWCDLAPFLCFPSWLQVPGTSGSVVSQLCRWVLIFSFIEMSLFSVSLTLQRCSRLCFPRHESTNPCFLIVLGITGVFKCSCCRFDTHITVTPHFGIFLSNFGSQCSRLKTCLVKQRERTQWNLQFSHPFVWAGTHFVVLTLGRIKDFSTKLNCRFFSSVLLQWHVDFSWYNFMDWVLKQWGKYVYY